MSDFEFSPQKNATFHSSYSNKLAYYKFAWPFTICQSIYSFSPGIFKSSNEELVQAGFRTHFIVRYTINSFICQWSKESMSGRRNIVYTHLLLKLLQGKFRSPCHVRSSISRRRLIRLIYKAFLVASFVHPTKLGHMQVLVDRSILLKHFAPYKYFLSN